MSIGCVCVCCSPDDTVGDLKKLTAAQCGAFHHPPPPAIDRVVCAAGTRPEKIRIQKWYNIYKDNITLADYEIHDGMGYRSLRQCCCSY